MQALNVRVVGLEATGPEGVRLDWRGRSLASGPLLVELDPEAGESGGTLDYARGQARVEFRVRLSFPEVTAMLTDLGFEAPVTAPFRGRLVSSGAILSDHSFVLSGPCQVSPHPLGDGARASVLPGT